MSGMLCYAQCLKNGCETIDRYELTGLEHSDGVCKAFQIQKLYAVIEYWDCLCLPNSNYDKNLSSKSFSGVSSLTALSTFKEQVTCSGLFHIPSLPIYKSRAQTDNEEARVKPF